MNDSPCKGCSRREVGCRCTCVELLVYNVLEQPEKERAEEEKRKKSIIEYDRRRRMKHMKNAHIAENSPTRCRKR